MNSNIARSVKDSGVNWIGQIPADWNTPKLRYLITKTNAGEVIDRGFWHDGDELLYTCQRTPMPSFYTDFPSWKRTDLGDLLLTRNGTPYVHLPVPGSIYSNVVQRVRVTKDCNTKFMWYVLSDAARSVSGYGDIIESFNMGVWKDLVLPLPSPTEQQNIVAFLDKKIASVDLVIGQKRHLIELLQEKRQALITQAVTKGLDTSVPMKDSGIEWLGEIPAHWETVFVKQAYEVQLGKMLQTQSEDGQDVLVNYLKALHVQWDSVDTSDLPQMWASPRDIDKYAVYQGDLVVCEGGEVGRAAIINGLKIPCIIQNALHRVRSGHHSLNRYLSYLLRVAHYNGWFEVLCNKATIAHLTGEKLGAMKIPLPPISEQVAIINFLESKIRLIDTLALKLERSIQSLNEYRQTLISAAVTGKIDVREEVAACP